MFRCSSRPQLSWMRVGERGEPRAESAGQDHRRCGACEIRGHPLRASVCPPIPLDVHPILHAHQMAENHAHRATTSICQSAALCPRLSLCLSVSLYVCLSVSRPRVSVSLVSGVPHSSAGLPLPWHKAQANDRVYGAVWHLCPLVIVYDDA
jgi:hypothetical protein